MAKKDVEYNRPRRRGHCDIFVSVDLMVGRHENPYETWLPKSVICLRYYDSFRLRSDLTAAVVLAVTMFPVNFAMSITAGVPLANGICGAAMVGVVGSLFGATKVQVAAPNLVLLTVALSIMSRGGVDDLVLTTLAVGAVLLFLSVTSLGLAIRFIPQTVVVGIMNGLAVLILAHSLPICLGLESEISAGSLVRAAGLPSKFSVSAVLVSSATLILAVACTKLFRLVPAELFSATAVSFFVHFVSIPIRTISVNHANYGGALSLALPSFHSLRSQSFEFRGSTISQALEIAVVIAIDSVAAERLAAGLTGEQQHPRLSLLVDGAANIACAFVGGFPGSGSVQATALNARIGAQTPVAGMIQGIFQFTLLLMIAPLMLMIPLPVIASIVVFRVLKMPHWTNTLHLLRLRNMHTGAWLATFLLVLAAPFPMALACAMLITMYLVIKERHITY